MTEEIKETKVIRLNSITDVPSPIEAFFKPENINILGVGRSDNTIELWNTDTWVQLVKLYGSKDLGLRRLFMLGDDLNSLRIFTAGLNGYLIEWSMHTMSQKVTNSLII
jgi:hypothetical protein